MHKVNYLGDGLYEFPLELAPGELFRLVLTEEDADALFASYQAAKPAEVPDHLPTITPPLTPTEQSEAEQAGVRG